MSSPPVGWMTQRRVQGKRLILAYHGIIPEGEAPAGEPALFVSQRDFAMQLDLLAAEADVVALERLDEPDDGRPRVAITIDDAYRGAVNVGVRELAARSLPATIFVAPARLNNHVFWWDALLYGSGKLDEKLRNHALHKLGGAPVPVSHRRGLAQGRLIDLMLGVIVSTHRLFRRVAWATNFACAR